MSNAELLLQEFQVKADHLVVQYAQKYKKSNDKNGQELDQFIEIIYGEFRVELDEAATDIIHQSIMGGVDDQLLLLNGIRGINLSSAQKIIDLIEE